MHQSGSRQRGIVSTQRFITTISHNVITDSIIGKLLVSIDKPNCAFCVLLEYCHIQNDLIKGFVYCDCEINVNVINKVIFVSGKSCIYFIEVSKTR